MKMLGALFVVMGHRCGVRCIGDYLNNSSVSYVVKDYKTSYYKLVITIAACVRHFGDIKLTSNRAFLRTSSHITESA
jgi:hypothetical protein